MKFNTGTILLVEDDNHQRGIIKTILTKEGFFVEDVDCGKKAIEQIKASSFDLVVTDLRLPDIDGTEVIKEVKRLDMACHVIIITAFGSIPSAIEATKLGAFYYLEKPFEKDQLLIIINNAMNQVRLLKDNIMLQDQLHEKFSLDNVVGVHGRMEELYKIVKKVAPTNSTVLIYGESGTGKELFAKSIHYNSPRRNKPFFAINCAAIPETLLESELFGYEKGAFTGAMTRHAGLFEQANGSSLFLDEIGDLTLSTQAKLLRAIQEREIRRIGGSENIRLDVRIIAATNKKLEEEIAKGAFREDLYYRLNVIAFSVPPLRERVADIPLLVEHFLSRLNEVHSRKKTISNEALQILMKYRWPGNVRQLESVMERAYIMCEDDVVSADYMPEEVKQEKAKNLSSNFEIPDEGLSLEEIERELIKKALMKAEGKISHAAKYLNMSYDKLWFKVKKLREKGDPLDFTK
ncbi:MAG TPA: sigma-54 dependent transcriptional regulator [Syntrophorhabdaceae bacterium]|jgi:DNA-binding NtrC family response regulator|nr:sigma-54-dependent Fis family transcriptional regulator [Syntrophorhabdaceae bacterium]MDI9560920.1 sigma-54 dependent transcriptional regulator [Pseudomonadota bacterium]OQC47411.1 MAG: Transcriptional regulatory protein ZraR [Deltaproteobacteria bacterium ADurb.Bin026]MBP8697806.1 sigma-54-dependent Fis family transcriptional regulator [Syntrophorhabdaceae bacterium]MBV6505777.1 Transcriptional regulatory protein ZraR [Syntrophorhabdaceae bacterium]